MHVVCGSAQGLLWRIDAQRGHCVQVKMYPHLFWGVLALLQAVHVPLFALILRVVNAMLGSLQLWNIPCQQILQVSAPQPLLGAPAPAGALPWHSPAPSPHCLLLRVGIHSGSHSVKSRARWQPK